MRALLPLLLLGACTGTEDDTTKTGDTATPDKTGTDEETAGETSDTGKKKKKDPVKFTVSGTAVSALNPEALVPEGVCAVLIDPTDVLLGGDVTVLAATAVGANGAFSFADVSTTSTIGLLVQLTDDNCSTAPAKSVGISSNTGIVAADYEDLKDGDTLTTTAFLFDEAGLAAVAGSAAIAAQPASADLTEGGWIYGFVLADSDPFTPQPGATVDCSLCSANEYFYLDGGTAGKSLFDDGAGANYTSTQAPLGNFLVAGVPEEGETGGVAEQGLYAASATGVSFGDPVLIAGFAGAAVIIGYEAQ